MWAQNLKKCTHVLIGEIIFINEIRIGAHFELCALSLLHSRREPVNLEFSGLPLLSSSVDHILWAKNPNLVYPSFLTLSTSSPLREITGNCKSLPPFALIRCHNEQSYNSQLEAKSQRCVLSIYIGSFP